MYLTIADANAYFDDRLNSEDWDYAELEDRRKSLAMAGRLIDRLNYLGDKTDDSQEHEFPRGGDTSTPTEITWACCEIAIKILDGMDSDMEVDALGRTKAEFTSIKNTYNANIVREHKALGMLSSLAWDYLRPYLRDVNSLALVRQS